MGDRTESRRAGQSQLVGGIEAAWCRLAALREYLAAVCPDAPGSRLDELEISLHALQALAWRAEVSERESLARVVDLKYRELGREMAMVAIEFSGYYALPVYNPALMGNEGPVGPAFGWDAMADLFGYVGGLDDMSDRDRIAALTRDAATGGS